MTIRDALLKGQHLLCTSKIEKPQLDAALILAYVCKMTREQLYMCLSEELELFSWKAFCDALHRRQSGEPLAWITGIKEFWGLSFHVAPGVFCPRPDSEILIETALQYIPPSTPFFLHDCCCGPGTLSLSISRERPLLEVSASDIADNAATYFMKNNEELAEGRVQYINSDLLEKVIGPFDMIVSNPPYLTPNETMDRINQGWQEPPQALNGEGDNGLGIISRLIPQATERLHRGGYLLLEAAPPQMSTIRNMLISHGFNSISIHQDLAGHNRAILAQLVNAV